MIRGGDVVKFSNSIELEIRGERALFRDPLRPQTLPVPSCEALKGILGSIYWNPDFIWVPDSLRVMEPIGYTREGARTSDGSRFREPLHKRRRTLSEGRTVSAPCALCVERTAPRLC